MTVQVKYNGNPNHQRSYAVTVDGENVANVPLVFLEKQGVILDGEETIKQFESELQSIFRAAYAGVDVAQIKEEAYRPQNVREIDYRRGVTRVREVQNPFAGFHLQCEFAKHNDEAYHRLGFFERREAPSAQVISLG